MIAFDGLKQYMPDYLSDKFHITNVRRNFPCPVCGQGYKTPCAAYDSRTDRVKCFSCGWNGDVIDLVSACENVSTAEAAKLISERYGNGLPNKAQATIAIKEKEEQSEQDFSEYIEHCSQSAEAVTFFNGRGLSAETVKRFNLGFDETRNEAIIPYGKDWYIARRNYDTDGGKYHIPKGSSRPYPYNAKRLIERTEEPCFVVEGEINTLSLEEIGFHACGIGSGTGWRGFISFIGKCSPQRPLIIMLDNDPAGLQAQQELIKGLPDGVRAVSSVFPFEAKKDINDILIEDREALKASMNEIYTSAMGERKPVKEDTNHASERLKVFLNRAKSDDYRPIPTGFRNLDQALGGGLYSGLCVIAGAPSEGKTTLATQILENICDSQRRDGVIFSFEMSAEDLLAKSISRETFILSNCDKEQAMNHLEVMRGYEWGKIEGAKTIYLDAAIKRVEEKAQRLYILDDCTPTVEAICDGMRRYLKPDRPAPIILIDYLQLIDTGAKEFTSACRDIFRELKRFANEHNTIIILIASVNREAQKNGSGMTSIYGSSFGEYGADVLLGLDFTAIARGLSYKDKDELKQAYPREMTVTIRKNRKGLTGKSVDFSYPAEFNYWTDSPNERLLLPSMRHIESRGKEVRRV